ncbi:MAG TPA: cysteine desulfurase family protein [Nitrososphaeraceae archaeon]|nr:cysteine desulfurase family protein [Nitrososphaeraceae archaeon]
MISFPISIYLDNAASTPVLDEVIQEMIPYLTKYYGNPSSLHTFGMVTSHAIMNARKRVASLIGANHREIIFTSGGTESDNTAIKGAALYARKQDPEKNHIVTSAIEHEAILEPCRDLEKKGFDVTYLPVRNDASLEPSVLENAISQKKTALVSIMFANNEVGTIQPISDLVKITHDKGGKTIFHTDAVQAIGKVPINVKSLGIDLLSLSSHKINGPKGVGALYIREGNMIDPLVHGGGQEFLMRSGTENVHGIVGFGKACEIASQRSIECQNKLTTLRNYLIEKVIDQIPYSRLNGVHHNRNSNNAHFTFFGVNGEDLILKLDEKGIAASTGSACSVKRQKSSHVLKAMGFSYEEIKGSLRFTLGIQNTKSEIDQTVSILSGIVEELRMLSPFRSRYH